MNVCICVCICMCMYIYRLRIPNAKIQNLIMFQNSKLVECWHDPSEKLHVIKLFFIYSYPKYYINLTSDYVFKMFIKQKWISHSGLGSIPKISHYVYTTFQNLISKTLLIPCILDKGYSICMNVCMYLKTNYFEKQCISAWRKPHLSILFHFNHSR